MEEVYTVLLMLLLFFILYGLLLRILDLPMDDDMFHEL
jgi:hypothetical protein